MTRYLYTVQEVKMFPEFMCFQSLRHCLSRYLFAFLEFFNSSSFDDIGRLHADKLRWPSLFFCLTAGLRWSLLIIVVFIFVVYCLKVPLNSSFAFIAFFQISTIQVYVMHKHKKASLLVWSTDYIDRVGFYLYALV